jgi:trimeric autotransporter adhesin
MTSNNQVSPVIRISRGERDASARATHLKAASKKYLETTIERKQMSTTTTFKRIALVAVAALGLGVLSSVPSQASIPAGNITISGQTNGTVTAAKSDSATAAKFALTYLKTATDDSVAVTTTLKSRATGSTGSNIALMPLDTKTSSVANTFTAPALGESNTAGVNVAFSGSGYVGGTFAVFLESATTVRTAGDYVVTVIVTPYENGAAVAANVRSFDLTITQAALAAESTAVSSSLSKAYMSQGATYVAGTTTDSTIAVAATASATTQAVVRVILKNAADVTGTVAESVTVTINNGSLGSATNTNLGAKQLVLQYVKATGYVDVFVFANGQSGVATINISTPSVTFPAKTLTFYGTTYKSIAAAPYASVIGTSSTVAVAGTALDENNSSFGSAITVYAYSSDTSVVSDFGTACTYNSTAKAALCSLTGVKNGTANITLRDKATLAASTVASNAVAVRVSTETAATVSLSTDKATYAPGEKGYLFVKVLDADGKVVPAGTVTNLFAAGGIVASASVGSASDTTTAVEIVTAVSTSAPLSVDPVKIYTFYAPQSGGNFIFEAKGGSSLPTAGQVAVSAKLTVTDSGAAALAAVTALATTVAALRTLIVRLTNLVLKIQKAVR